MGQAGPREDWRLNNDRMFSTTYQNQTHPHVKMIMRLEDTARYAGLLLAPAEGFGRGQKRAYYAVLAHFWHF